MLPTNLCHKPSKDMAPEPASFLRKVRNSLIGKPHHHHPTRSQSLTIAKIDNDSPIRYLHDPSLDRYRFQSQTISVHMTTTNSDSGIEAAETSSHCVNGKVLCFSPELVDENANRAITQKMPEVTLFEKQGARPKVRNTLKGNPTSDTSFADALHSRSTSDETAQPNAQVLVNEPPGVELAQPHFAVSEVNCSSCSTCLPSGASPCKTTAASLQADAPGKTRPAAAAIADSNSSELELPNPVLASNTQLSHGQRVDDSNFKMNDGERMRQKPLAHCEAAADEVSLSKSFTLCNGKRELSNPTYNHFDPAELCIDKPENSQQADDKDVPLNILPTADEAKTFLCNDNKETPSSSKRSVINADGLDESLSESKTIGCKTPRCYLENVKIVDESCTQTPPNCVDTSTGRSENETPDVCIQPLDDKHCSTCTCENKNLTTGTNALPKTPQHECNASKRLSLTLHSIPSEVEMKQPRTPHIAMLVNTNVMFPNNEIDHESITQEELELILKLDNLSVKESNGKDEILNQEKAPIKDNHYFHTSGDCDAPASSLGTNSSKDVVGATGGEPKPPAIDRSSKPKDPRFPAHPDSATVSDPPPLPPRLPQRNAIEPLLHLFEQFDDDDDLPTHEFLHEIYADSRANSKSKSLPRGGAPGHQPPSPQALRTAKRGKTVNMRNRFSQIFKQSSKKKRHSTLGFPDRPLPDIPPAPGAGRTFDAHRSSLFGTSTGDIVSPEAAKEGLLSLPRTKEQVEKSREQFAISLRRISEYGWYWGPMSWDDAECRLENMPDGSFLVRDSSDDRHLLSLSFRAQGSTHHTRVEHQNGKFSFWSQPCSHGSASIVEFVEEAMRHSRSGRVLYFLRPRLPGFPPAAVQLLYPISRFQKSRSLQHICRFVIRKHVRLDHIDSLTLPRRLRDYLKESQYYTQDDILH